MTVRSIHRATLFSCLLLVLLAAIAATPIRAADAAGPDVLVFSNGDNLTGKLDHESDNKVFFKSDNAGMVKVPWAKLKSLRTQGPFAVIEIGVPIHRKRPNRDVPFGPISLDGDTLTVTTAQGAQQVPVAKIAYLIDEPTFEKNVRSKQSLLQGITGSVSAGASTVNSTQNSVSVNSAVVLSRAVPPVDWMPARERTLLNFNSNYGRVSQPATPTVKTNIIHGGLQENEYFSPRFYLLQQAMFDHNFSQGLDLQQLYGIGVGFTAIKNSKQQLDFTATMDYTKQQFLESPPGSAKSTNLVGSSFADNYLRNFPRKIVFTEIAAFNPAWNTPSDYSANAAVGATFPVFKNFGFSVGVVDSFLNDPPPGFKKNSVQFNTGLTYSLSR